MSHNADDDSSYQLYLEPQKQGGGRQDDPHPQHSSTSGRTSLGAYEYSQPSARDQHSLGEQPPLGAYGYSQLSSGDYEYSQASTGEHKYSQFSSASYEDSQASTGDHEYSQSSSATYRYSQPSARDHEYSHSSSGFSTVQQTWPRYYYETPSENELENEDPHPTIPATETTPAYEYEPGVGYPLQYYISPAFGDPMYPWNANYHEPSRDPTTEPEPNPDELPPVPAWPTLDTYVVIPTIANLSLMLLPLKPLGKR
ncbi:hypothetical protein F5890DRAFT_1553811 [Lentinula detonsa]|uniref:Uncharacterized protein n=1 Tax=Lentinula detonsa TaxID=2804962 RepID=A0AA38PZY9_9AGAR|nr:hypothetical protein F5890DRAFT_1553811 [Lentinula detonsa]